ncbi:DUF3014 domain-containing protein [Shewanella sp. VB17]|uniref:DUF3014 domain-containing protein n=1 Tax=Shewanella sp. VB17 TaxID=2739432 RepID=UPI00156357F9|nr:DUF3014 domain-containing protein [Shewanella sp. VB17]NRD72209.1 DUF3014 domain-containing protein [Shewanella sp. VB17]
MQVNQEDRIEQQEKPASTSTIAIVAIVVLLLLSGGAYYYFSANNVSQNERVDTVELPDPVPSEPLAIKEQPDEPIITVDPKVIEDVVITPPAEPLPALSDSDPFVHNKTIQMANDSKIEPYIVEKNILRHFVVFVDNLAQGELARKVSPLKAPNQVFTVSEITNKTYLNPDSYHRYDQYADFVNNLNEAQLKQTYQDLTPLLTVAFEELGYGDMNFTDRMLKAIDVMLDAPITDSPIELNSISVNYQFADPRLESLPNAQKLLIRMGPENSKKVKSALRKLKKSVEQ